METGAPHCIFCSIAGGTSPACLVWEDSLCAAFLDHRPLFPGHCLVIPREHHATWDDLPRPLLHHLASAAQLLSLAVQSGLGAQGSFIAVNNTISQSVPHVHVHVVPRRKGDGLRGFFWPRRPYSSRQEMLSVQAALRSAAAALAGGHPWTGT